jgi:hypothetical protein
VFKKTHPQHCNQNYRPASSKQIGNPVAAKATGSPVVAAEGDGLCVVHDPVGCYTYLPSVQGLRCAANQRTEAGGSWPASQRRLDHPGAGETREPVYLGRWDAYPCELGTSSLSWAVSMILLLFLAARLSVSDTSGNCTATLPGQCIANPHNILATKAVSKSAGECCATCYKNAACASWQYWIKNHTTQHACRLFRTIVETTPCPSPCDGTSGILAPRPTPTHAPTPPPVPAPPNAPNILYINVGGSSICCSSVNFDPLFSLCVFRWTICGQIWGHMVTLT